MLESMSGLLAMGLVLVSVAQNPIGPPPAEFGLDPFYKKGLVVRGIPVVSSARVSDEALREAAFLVAKLLEKRPELAKPMTERKLRVAIMAPDEMTLDIPEHSDLQEKFPGTDWNARARGLGATEARPAVSAGEENLLGLPGDRYVGESILIHEFAHTVLNFGLESVDEGFRTRLRAAFDASKGTAWKNTYAATNPDEYWAEGVQSWFDANRKGPKEGNGVHNHLWNRDALREADPALYELLSEVFVADWKWKPPKR